MKIALVLEGGAMRGIYTAGVLDVLMDNNITVDCVMGVSAGALFGVNYISRQKGRTLRYNKKYIKDKRYMGIHSLLTTGNIINKEFCFDTLVNELDKFDFDTFSKSKTNFYVVVTNLETGQAEYKKITDLKKDMEYLRASGSMPLVSRIVEINNHKYLDGGIGDSIPIKQIQNLGYEKVIVVLTRPIEYRKKQTKLLPYKLLYRKYPNFIKTISNRFQKYNETVDYIIQQEKENKIFVIRPSTAPDVKRLEKDLNKIQALYDLGVRDTNNSLKDMIKYISE